MKIAAGILLIALAGCASVSRKKQAQVQTSFNQTTAPIQNGAMQRAAASH
jgi:hypothetical protein